MLPRLTDQQRACAEAIGLTGSIVHVRRHRKWDAWSAVCIPAREVRAKGSTPLKRYVRGGRPRTMWELKRGYAHSCVRNQEIASAIQYLRERGLLPDDVVIQVERSRRVSSRKRPPPRPRIVKAKPIKWPAKLCTKEYHRDFD
jgi:hypothetical protein